jgi:hypothetical protein
MGPNSVEGALKGVYPLHCQQLLYPTSFGTLDMKKGFLLRSPLYITE